MKIRIKAPGKLILLGEYAVLEGADALVAAIDRYVIVSVSPSNKKDFCQITTSLDLTPFVFKINDKGKILPEAMHSAHLLNSMRFAIAATEHVCSQILKFDFPLSPFQLHIDTSQFYTFGNKSKFGLGSSAALTVAIITALANYFAADAHMFKNEMDLFRYAFKTHLYSQGNRGSGIDIASSVFGGVIVYNIGLIKETDSFPRQGQGRILEDLFMLPVWTGVAASTRQLLSKIDHYKNKKHNIYKETMLELQNLSNQGCLAYMNNNKRIFLDMVDKSFTVLKNFSNESKIDIISEVHQKIAGLVHNKGGIYKPSGAGGGDFGLAFFENNSAMKKAENLLSENKFGSIPLKVESKGVKKINDLRF